MSRWEKRLAQIRNSPKSVRFEDIDALLTGLGFAQRQRGNHVVFSKPGVAPITVPIRKPFILPIYVKQILDCLDNLDDEPESKG
jgi:predicted RNA binding protein YcfA (HicA-like mRNA interferase family)